MDSLELVQISILVIASFVAGFVDAVAGGGGVVTFPAFLLLGLPVAETVGTVKLVSTFGTLAAAWTFLRQGKISPEVVRIGAPLSVVGALVGAVVVLILPNDFLKPVVSLLIITVALYCFFRPKLGAEDGYRGLTTRTTALLSVAAFSLGAYDGFFGPGTGIFLTFFFIHTLKFDFVRAAGNTKVLNLASNAAALTYFLTQGNIRYDLGIPMLIANVAGGYVGARFAIRHGSSFVKWVYMVMALLTAGKLILT